jgi:hypothetical protein
MFLFIHNFVREVWYKTYLEKLADKGYALFPRVPNNKLNLELLRSTSFQIFRKLATFISLSVAEYLSTATDRKFYLLAWKLPKIYRKNQRAYFCQPTIIKPTLEIVEEHIAVNPPQISKLHFHLPWIKRPGLEISLDTVVDRDSENLVNPFMLGRTSSLWHSEHWAEITLLSDHCNALFYLNSRIPLGRASPELIVNQCLNKTQVARACEAKQWLSTVRTGSLWNRTWKLLTKTSPRNRRRLASFIYACPFITNPNQCRFLNFWETAADWQASFMLAHLWPIQISAGS